MDFKIREIRTVAQGPKKLLREREAYSQLMQQGLSNKEACRIVGINEKTGRRWRNGRSADRRQKAAPPIHAVVPPSGPSRYLREDDRIYIADRLREKATVRAIAAELGRSPSTVSREIRRNRHPGNGQYRPHAAQARADARRPRPKPGKISQNPELRRFIQDRLHLRWSPEQICQALRAQFPQRPEMHVVHETVYQALYVQGRGELRRELARALRTGRARRKPRRQAQQRQPRFSTPMVMISERPAEAEDRAVPGHWEGDLIIGKDGASAIGTLVERATRYVMLLHLPDGRSAEHVRDALTDTVQTLPAHLVRSLTWDQGAEMAAHGAFTIATDIPVYFCDPASPWQRGSNENTNGLLRQYFPKGTDLSVHTREHLDAVAAELNGRPRKTLGWETPAERLHKLLAA
ncbi:integrase [Streptantibioticus cattleyicolor NRRL 8057 = DSM 46488]|uniref:Integrase n=2 Tax=Streptantibioticus cattleyicolor TaxID=29303 RepID=G8X046_STREN|nr:MULTISPECIES: IS30 family transposase [Streptomycetaceae]AEW93854.1 integrase [Streptantibioticus cattleyicolor NRRL 8057 = DSM 46488]AEW95721.1 integrase [Streptantibioticus cattleyicolor NRRL 8057 = DSM 46488]AEW96037.1 integrase [Streptantibioticus cattleyicolor NRRL 8057 = DSM 46488]MYS60266.1 IS30 family transposase [Streptomyces sp. SID5468]CCB76061.1 transposase [Streptantibioticus cattleyicolor NRRL 8057 = DSM 46488]